MVLLKNINELKVWCASQKSIGFVPTMGALHAGHLSLVKAATLQSETVLVSIFVNPTQFDEVEDLENYPNTLDDDLTLLKASGVSAVFLPDFDQLYPDDYRYQLSENDFSMALCGAHRPGHFDGVLTVVMKLFNLVKPAKAFFGEKDYQQLRLIRGMVKAFFLDVEVVPCPIIREKDGLAMSSRNMRLSKKEREIAPQLFKIISSGQSIERMQKMIEAAGFELDYLTTQGDRLLVAATLGEIRLIDNVPYNNLRTLKKPVELRSVETCPSKPSNVE
ncbi:pantoate--beta-alanine ligase [Marinicella rhabdoformis]|uniref:pantoate--beta-alanine ligase n=1 Tax=Marinicella rhabdoformis TaxID=2580566 RepID=UPI001C5536D4|nr:pantoate--beta-alanine ligase [Marinicella rhabdoformis]